MNKIYLATIGLFVTVGAIVALTGTSAQAVSSARNCNDDAIVRCGAVSEKELLQKYDANTGDIQNIYKHYGITRADLTGTASEIKHGTVYQNGNVVVDGKIVATNAHSVSRVAFNDKNGNKPRTVKINGTTLYEGPNMSIFVRSVDTYVFFRNGQFHKAVISSCANPLIATPTPQPKPQPKPEKPVKPTPKPEYCEVEGKEHLPKNSPDCKETPIVPEVPKTPEVPEAPEELPQTGLGAFISGSLGLGSITGAGYYWVVSRKNLLSTLLNK